MRDEFLEVIALQREYTNKNSAAMQRRGELIRNIIPRKLQVASTQIKLALGRHGQDLGFEGRDGTGNKTLIPWVRFFSRARSPSAQNGWYCVYLFDAPGTSVYLELGHGSTTLAEGDYRPRPPEQLAKLVTWGQEVLKSVIHAQPSLSRLMALGGGKLGGAYERSGVIAKWYPANEMPSDETLYNDAVTFASYLKVVYDAEVLGLAPNEPPPEVLEVEGAAAGPIARRGNAQGFGLTPAERRVVELRAMSLAEAHLRKLNWRVKDVSSTKPYDFECSKGADKLIVEVKGTTSTGERIVITRNELAAHRARYPTNALIVVHHINLIKGPEGPSADGGELMMLWPWEINEEFLKPLAFQYTIDRVVAK
jgi:hypothetical protein